jgi:hypothetical protein
MRLMFVHYLYEDRGSAQDVHNFAVTAREMGHEVALYGPPNPQSPFNYSLDMAAADAVIFIFEWTTDLQFGDRLDWLRLVGGVPRQRRVVIDCDGKYNDAISVVGDYNHPDAAASRRWLEVCDSLSDKIYQPTYHPLRCNVGTYFFHAYNPAWEAPLDFRGKEYGMFYVGHNWFRWRSIHRVLRAVEPVRPQLGRIGMVGHGWASRPPWANSSIGVDAYYSDPEYLTKLQIEVMPPILFGQVIEHMGKGVIHPVVYRPLFNHLQLVTCRTFETFAANTVPLFGMDEAYVEEIYGGRARELVLPADRAEDKIVDILRRPDYYAGIVQEIRKHLAAKHSYAARLQELIDIVERDPQTPEVETREGTR